ncbi:biotin synthase BioB [Puteibacter caeruleilacunae]|nr:biotin synthase BioB [Puteibacter caeruleilacunae]
MNIEMLKEKVLAGGAISQEEAIALTQTKDKQTLYNAANEIREKMAGNKMDLCSITNAKSGKCSEDCKWCSQSAFFKTKIEEYEMVDEKEAVEAAVSNAKQGVHRYSLVTSGRAISNSNLDRLVNIYGKIREKASIGLCASMGLLDKARLQKLKDAGVEHYHCNLETSRSHFPNMCSTHSFDQKVLTIKWAQEIGMKVCSGGILGLGETMEQRIEMAFELNEIGVKSIPLNILNPIEGTAMEGTAALTDDEILTSFAIFRFINPDASIRFAGGRLQIKHIQEQALKAGINAALVGDLLTTIGSNIEEDKKDFQAAGFVLDTSALSEKQ